MRHAQPVRLHRMVLSIVEPSNVIVHEVRNPFLRHCDGSQAERRNNAAKEKDPEPHQFDDGGRLRHKVLGTI